MLDTGTARTAMRLATGVELVDPEIVLVAELSCVSVSFVVRTVSLRHETGAQYSATEKLRARVAVRRVLADASNVEPASLVMRLFLVRTLAAVFIMRTWKGMH